jgi:hypothetical protein
VPEAHEATPARSPEETLADLCSGGGVLALLGDRDPVQLVGAAAEAAGKPFAAVDSRGLTTLDFDRLVRGQLAATGWELGAASRMMLTGGVFVMAHGETLLDDLRQRTCRMLLTRKILLRGPMARDDRLVEAAPGATLILHVNDHVPVLLQVYAQLKLFPARLRADVSGPPPVARR